MFKLIKYEWLRRWRLFLAGTLVFVLTDVDLFSRIVTKENPNFISVILIALLFALGALLVLDHMGRLYRSLFTNEGYTDLTLPLNGYQMLGAKFLAVVLECVAVMVIVVLVGYADMMYIARTNPNWQMPVLAGSDFVEMLQVLSVILGGYLIFILMVYLSLTLAKSFFASFKHGMLIAFICFLLIAKALEYVNKLLSIGAGYIVPGVNVVAAIPDWGVAVIIAVLFTATAYLLDRKINL
jgi:ABC-2 type transport system permease protein